MGIFDDTPPATYRGKRVSILDAMEKFYANDGLAGLLGMQSAGSQMMQANDNARAIADQGGSVYDQIKAQENNPMLMALGTSNIGKAGQALAMDEASRMARAKADGISRAIEGGQDGINGYSYKGGQFLPSTEAPPGTWRVKAKGKYQTIANGAEEIEPGVSQPRPTPFSKSIMKFMGGGTYVNIDKNGVASVNPNINWDYLGYTPHDKQPVRFKNLAQSKDQYSISDLVDMYNKGERWVHADPADGVEIVAKSPVDKPKGILED